MTMLQSEIWLPIKGFETKYEVSSLSNIRTIKTGRIKKQNLNPNGYLMVVLTKGINKYPHRLSAEAFIPNPLNLPQVNHLDGNKQNNDISNFEWASRSRNIKHGFEMGLITSNGKGKFLSLNPNSKSVIAIKEMTIIEFGSLIECAKYIGAGYSNLARWIVDKEREFNGFLVYSI